MEAWNCINVVIYDIVCYIASADTKRDWLICGHVTSDKCNVSRGATSEKLQNSLLNSYFVANLKLCFNIVRGHDEKTLENCYLNWWQFQILPRSSSPPSWNTKMQWNRFRTTRGYTCFKAFTGVSPPILIDALVVRNYTRTFSYTVI
jgi:hypothetical protein